LSNSRLNRFLLVQAITLGRAPLILIFLIVTLMVDTRESSFWFAVALFAMILAALTDTVDGYLARKFKVESTLGAYADPLTDKIFYLTAFPTLVYLACFQRTIDGVWGDLGSHVHAKLLLCLAILFLMRDQWVSFLRSLGAIHNLEAKANWSGKLRTIISFPVICIIYYYLQAPQNRFWDLFPVYRWPVFVYSAEVLSLAINVISIWVYTVRFWPALKKEIKMFRESEDV